MTLQNVLPKIIASFSLRSRDTLSRLGHTCKLRRLCCSPVSDIEEIFTPMNSQAKQDKAKILLSFPDYTADRFQRHNIVTLDRYIEVIGKARNSDDNVLLPSSLDSMASLSRFLQNLTITDADGTYSYSELCAKAFGNCLVSGSYLLSNDFRARIQANNVTYPVITTSTAPIEIDEFLGDVTVVNGKVTKARYCKLRFNLRQDEGMENKVQAMESKFIEELEKYEPTALDISYSMSRSLDEELQGSISGDITFFSLTFTLMITYVSVISITTNMVASHANLARLGVLSTGLGLVGGLGLVCATGLDFVQIVGTTPFLLIGVGIDDIFVLLSGLAGSYGETEENTSSRSNTSEDADEADINVEKRIAETMRTSGVAITITTVTNVLALAIGASSVFVSVRNFSVYTGVCFLMAYLNHLTFFTGMMVFHERRVEKSRHEMLCCKELISRQQAEEEGRSCAFLCCCTGSKPRNRDEAENPLEKAPHIITTKIISWLPSRIFIFISFAALIGVAIWGVTQFRSGLELADLTVDGSYYKTYSTWLNDHFKREEPVSIVIEDTVEYNSGSVQSQIDELVSNLKQDSSVDDDFEINWLKDFRAFPAYDNSSLTSFMTVLRTQFLAYHPNYVNDIVFSSNNASITTSRLYVRTKGLKKSQSQADSMQRLRDVVSASDLPAFCFAPGFVFYEQYVAVVPNTLQTVGVALGAVILVTCLFMPSFLMIVYVTLALTVSLVEIFGFMHFWGLTLSSVTMIHIIMSVGFSVDFESHICHAYLVAHGSTRQEKIMNALKKVSGPVTHGAVSSVLGLLMLIFSKSFIFRSFFQVMFLVIVFGLGQTLFLLPAVLFYTGPRTSSGREDNSTARRRVSPTVRNGHVSVSCPPTEPPPDCD